jgi:hypothetical protein
MDNTLRYFGSAAAFGVGVVWMTVGLGSAIVCLLLAVFGYGAVFFAERAQANASVPRWRNAAEDPPLIAAELEPEAAHHLEPSDDDASTPLAAEAEYGWPWPTESPEIARTESR